MHRFIRIVVLVAVCLSVAAPGVPSVHAAPAAASTRLVVFEAFLRPNGCANSKAAAPVIDQLAEEYAGQNVLFLEYDPDTTGSTRASHFFAAQGGGSATLPLAMVESGYRYTSGYQDFHTNFAEMIDTVQSMQAMAGLSATWAEVDDNAEVYVTVHNTSGINLTKNNAHLHILVYAEEGREEESPYTHLTNRYVLGDYQYPLALANGAQASLTKSIEPIGERDWDTVSFVVLVDYLQSSGAYFSLQAALATPEAESTTVSVAETSLGLVSPVADTSTVAQPLHLTAPISYAWSVTVNAARPAEAEQAGGLSWLQVSPTGGSGPGTLQVSILNGNMEAGSYQGSIVIWSPDSLFAPITIPVTAVKTSIPQIYLPVMRK